jgi:hypothetical protein
MTIGLALLAIAAFFCALYAGAQVLNRRQIARNRAALESIGDCYPILMPVCDRPDYLGQVIDGLCKSIGIEETVLVFTQDERNPEVKRLIDEVPLRKIHLEHTQPFFAFFARIGLITRIHCTASNIFYVIDSVMRHTKAKGVIVLEDDLVPSVNFYQYFKWCFDRILLNPDMNKDVLSCGAYNVHCKGQIPFTERHSLYRIDQYFNPWGWAIARERWEQIRGEWSFTSWDGNMEHKIMRKHDLVNLYPYLSHIDYIGAHGVNMSRSEDCEFFRAVLDTNPISFDDAEPRISDDLPAVYQEEMKKYERLPDPDHPSEWDQKLIPVLWDAVKARMTHDRVISLKRIFPWL